MYCTNTIVAVLIAIHITPDRYEELRSLGETFSANPAKGWQIKEQHFVSHTLTLKYIVYRICVYWQWRNKTTRGEKREGDVGICIVICHLFLLKKWKNPCLSIRPTIPTTELHSLWKHYQLRSLRAACHSLHGQSSKKPWLSFVHLFDRAWVDQDFNPPIKHAHGQNTYWLKLLWSLQHR